MNETNLERSKFSKLLDYLSNFKKLSRIMVIVSAIGLLVSILLFVCFEISGGKNGEYFVCAFSAKTDSGKYLNIFGFILFAVGVVALVMSAVVGYQGLAFAFPKDKMNVKKALPWCCFVGGVAEIVAAVFSILVVAIDKTIIGWAWIILAIVLVLLGVVNILFVLPVTRRELWMPKYGTDDVRE